MRMGIDLQIVMPPPPQCYHTVPPDIAVRAAAMVNDGIAAFVAQQAGPFRGARHGADAGRRGRGRGAGAVHEDARLQGRADPHQRRPARNCRTLPTSRSGRKAEALGAVVFIHPNGFTEARRFGRFYFNNVIGNPLDTSMALHYLIFDGVLERHPALKIVAVHGGGYLPAYSGRIDHAWGARSDCARRPAASADHLSEARSTSTPSCSRRTSSTTWSKCSASSRS